MCGFYAGFMKIMLFPANFNLPVFTSANMNAFVAAPRQRRLLRSCSSMAGSGCPEIEFIVGKCFHYKLKNNIKF